ncbi:NADPH:quinone reductase-like Zn-dependent oxidoreductase [Amycolatopsis lexingtonensis]|uniref:NADPH:quinone reductase-like Zn-dependent oxidoreductase n=1 Tax=Amycolatopsis lexingtonensis TaxID=218822 RepID=A0ABR9HSE4_9PSEU|nr:NADP-dependent oxidoreductase [Amycolatopsis lexingtonensis]MBE1493846.1 NADPH:quinone reductase-like Zn-dependent oxidoreductase [Amycolatopsis lexingtonensis]
MKALQFDRFGAPDMVVLRDVPVPEPGPGRIRIAVRACGLNPADWSVVDGLLADQLPPLPRGLGLEVAGVVDALGEGVTGAAIGDRVFGPATFDGPTAGAAEYALMATWARIPEGVTDEQAAALTMAAETAWQALDDLGVRPGELLFVHGAGSTVGEAAVRFALHRGLRVTATAGPRRAAALEAIGARVTSYGDGMAGRVTELAGGHVDRALDAAPSGGRIDRPDQVSPSGGALPALVELTGDPDRVVTVSDFAAAGELGTRITRIAMRYDRLGEFARLAGEGVLAVPVAGAYPLDRVREVAKLSRSRQPGGKLVLVP